jgi:hypothetical protein
MLIVVSTMPSNRSSARLAHIEAPRRREAVCVGVHAPKETGIVAFLGGHALARGDNRLFERAIGTPRMRRSFHALGFAPRRKEFGVPPNRVEEIV